MMSKLSCVVKMGSIFVALLFCGQLFAWGTRCDISGADGKIELLPEGPNIQHVRWGRESERKYSLFMQEKNLPEGPKRISFSFIPQSDGFVTVNFNGCWAQRGGFKNQDREITRISDIKLEGAELKNGSFKEKNSQGKFRHWNLGPDCVVEGNGVNVWNLSGAAQTIRVTTNQKVSISYTVEFVEFEPAEK